MASKSYSMVNDFPLGASGTGLDQILDYIGRDPGLAGASLSSNLINGMLAADNLNKLIIEAKSATGVASNGIFTVDDVVAINEWIRQNRLTEFTLLHGDDNGGVETGFHCPSTLVETTHFSGRL